MEQPVTIQNGQQAQGRDDVEPILAKKWLVMSKIPSDSIPKFIYPPCGDAPTLFFLDKTKMRIQASQEAVDYSVVSISRSEDDTYTINYQLGDDATESMTLKRKGNEQPESFVMESTSDFISGYYPDSINRVNNGSYTLLARTDNWRAELTQSNRIIELPCDMD